MTGPVGYYPSPWPGEDGGPRRDQAPHGLPGLTLADGETLQAKCRDAPGAGMVVLRDPGEVYVQGCTFATETTAWVERVDPESLDPVARSPELPGGPFWPGGIAVHANGDLYVTYGRWCHRLAPDLAVVAARELPQPRPYNSLLVLPSGHLVMKDFVMDGSARSRLVVLEPERLEPVGPEVEVPEGSIARLSADGDVVYVVGDHTAFRYRWDAAAATLTRDEGWRVPYRRPDQSFGWDPVIAGGQVWWMDNGEHVWTGSLRGGGVAPGALHLVRAAVADAADHELVEVSGLPHGVIVNPPLFDPERGIAVAYDSGNGVVAGMRRSEADGLVLLWRRELGQGMHMIRFPDTGEVVAGDHGPEGEHVVVLDVETGEVRGRVATGSPIQSVVFPAPGWDRDVYTTTFTTLTRVSVA
ncbi:MAG: hypothetical protein FJW88_03285 [Actinobacteria bacterium]|nr:hypothetical protein [Actinomycetota bacterium]